jgi:SAM-dependent methyltransferase
MKGFAPTVSISPVPGWARSGAACNGTFDTVMAGISRLDPKHAGGKLLDIGCGTGYFTVPIGRHYEEIHGVDVSAECIAEFQACAPRNYTAHLIDAAELPFPTDYFDAIVTIETLEHVTDLPGVAMEAARVLREGGELIITVPNRWYPIEGHGGTVFGRHYPRIPLVTWFPPIHERVAKARVFTVRSLDRLFVPLGFRRCAVSYIWPTFEHGGGGSKLHGHIQQFARGLFPLMRIMERSRLRFFGSSVIVRYEKETSCSSISPKRPEPSYQVVGEQAS